MAVRAVAEAAMAAASEAVEGGGGGGDGGGGDGGGRVRWRMVPGGNLAEADMARVGRWPASPAVVAAEVDAAAARSAAERTLDAQLADVSIRQLAQELKGLRGGRRPIVLQQAVGLRRCAKARVEDTDRLRSSTRPPPRSHMRSLGSASSFAPSLPTTNGVPVLAFTPRK